MFVKDATTGFVRGSHQQKSSGYFLVLLKPDYRVGTEAYNETKGDLRALIRHCTMKQMGHYMMGKVRIANETFTMTGTYGNSGLPKRIDPEIWENAVPLPEELYEAWKTGGGHNSAGSEAEAMHEWANQNFDELHNAGT